MSRAFNVAILVAWTLIFSSCQGLAHDLWIIPPEEGTLQMPWKWETRSGMDFPKSVNVSDPAKYSLRNVIRPDGRVEPIEKTNTGNEVGILEWTPDLPGIYIVTVQTTPKVLELEAQEFNAYLVSDGLPSIYRIRHEESTLDRPGLERYSKSPKAIMKIGQGGGDPCQVVGLPLEIVPVDNPFECKVQDTLRVRVLFQGRALEDANLGWDYPGDGDPPSGTVRTDANGEALIPVSQTGLMTIRLTHMTRPKTAEYEWESFWTTLTFRIPG